MKLLLIALISSIQTAVASPDLEAFPYRHAHKSSMVSAATNGKLPQQVLDILRKHEFWQTASGIFSPGLSPVITSNQKWQFQGSSLKEITKLTLLQDCATKKFLGWKSAQVDLSASYDARDFLVGAAKLCNPAKTAAFKIIYLDGDRFVLEPLEGGLVVIFFPAIESLRNRPPRIQSEVHLFTSPLGLNDGIRLEGMELPRNDYLHHDLNASMPVVLDESFPDQFVETLSQSLAKWNEAIGAHYFQIEPTKKPLDLYDCLSSRKLCFLWKGPTEFSFLGVSGLTGIVFNPQSGEISGGYIGLQGNLADKYSQAPFSPALERFQNEQTSSADIAALFLQRSELSHYLHPRPLWALGYAITHELGHFQGLKHNFYGSTTQAESVMDYLAFSAVNSKSSNVGALDLEALALAYQGKDLSSAYRFCTSPMASNKGVSPDPNCNLFDYGQPEQWFISLAEAAPEKVFSLHPRFEGILLDYLGAFLQEHKPSVTPAQKSTIQRYLCTNYSADEKVFAHLKEASSVELVCN